MNRDEELERFAIILAKAFPNRTANEVARFSKEIRRLGRRAKRLAVQNCNGPWGDADDDKHTANAVAVSALCCEFDQRIEAHVGGDPRGYTIKLILPTRVYNTWGGEESGYGVPGS